MLHHAAFGNVLASLIFDSDALGCVGLWPAPKGYYQHRQRRNHASAQNCQPSQSQAPHHARGTLAFLPRSAATRASGLGGGR